MDELRLRMVSSHSVLGDFDSNLRTMARHCRDAASDDVDMICFPELSLTGYSMPHSRFHPLEGDDLRIGAISDLSGELGMAVCFGYADSEGHIVQAMAENGRIVGSYSKTHLGEREAEAMVPGDALPVIATSKAKVGISLCWEAHFPEIVGTYALDGADMILMPFASGLGGERRQSSWDRFLPARAYDNTVFVAACNMYGDNGMGVEFGGGAAVYDVRGFRMASAEGECSLTVDLDPEQMRRIRRGRYESMRDVYFLDKRRPELYGRLEKRLREKSW